MQIHIRGISFSCYLYSSDVPVNDMLMRNGKSSPISHQSFSSCLGQNQVPIYDIS